MVQDKDLEALKEAADDVMFSLFQIRDSFRRLTKSPAAFDAPEWRMHVLSAFVGLFDSEKALSTRLHGNNDLSDLLKQATPEPVTYAEFHGRNCCSLLDNVAADLRMKALVGKRPEDVMKERPDLTDIAAINKATSPLGEVMRGKALTDATLINEACHQARAVFSTWPAVDELWLDMMVESEIDRASQVLRDRALGTKPITIDRIEAIAAMLRDRKEPVSAVHPVEGAGQGDKGGSTPDTHEPKVHKDGPDGNGIFWDEGVGHEPRPSVMDMLVRLYGKGWLSYQTLGEQIWGDTGTAAATIETSQKRVNKWLKEKKLPYSCTRDHKRVKLKRDPQEKG